MLFASPIVDLVLVYSVCRFTGFTDWPLIVSLPNKNLSEETS